MNELKIKELKNKKELEDFIKSQICDFNKNSYFILEDEYTDNPTLYKISNDFISERMKYSFEITGNGECWWNSFNDFYTIDEMIDSVYKVIVRDYETRVNEND